MTVKNPSIKLNQTEATLTVNGTVKLSATTAPKSAASSVTYTTSNDKVATVAADGTVTAVGAGDATITASAKVGSKNPSKTAKITVKKVALQSVKQTKLKTIEAVVAGKTDDLKKDDFKLQNKTTGVQITVDSILVDKADPTKVTITTFEDMKNSNDIDVTLDGITKSFKATDAKVAGVAVDPVSIPFAARTKIYVVAKDANGVELTRTEKSKLSAGYSLKVEPAKSTGYFGDDMLYLEAKGDTATAEAEYATGTFDATGKAEVLTSGKVTITAVDPEALVLGKVSVRYGTASDKGKMYDDLKDGKVIAKDDTVYAAVKILDSKNTELSDYAGYYLESSDNNVLIIDNKELTGSTATVKMVGVNKGTVTILVKDKAGNVVQSFQVNVQEKRAVAGLKVNHAAFTVSNKAAESQRTFEFSAVDQYGDKIGFADKDLSGEYLRKSTDDTATANQVNSAFSAISNKRCTLNPVSLDAGIYTYRATLTGQHGLKYTADVKVTVKVPKASATKTWKLILVDQYGFETDKALDTTITKDNAQDIKNAHGLTACIRLVQIQDGVVTSAKDITMAADKKADQLGAGEILVKAPNASTVTSGAITANTNQAGIDGNQKVCDVKAITVVGDNATKNVNPGDYTVSYKVDDSTADNAGKVISLVFTVKDSQEKPGWKRVDGSTIDGGSNNSNSAITPANAITAVRTAFEFYDYDGSKLDKETVIFNPENPTKDFESVAGGIYVKKLTTSVNIKDVNGDVILTVPVNNFDFNQYIALK